MFNKEIKERFLDECNVIESTKRNYRYILEKAERTERSLNDCDVYQMSPAECDSLIYSFPRGSKGVIYGIISVFKDYFNFCKKIKLVPDEEFNYFETIKGDEGVERFLDKTRTDNKFISFEDLNEIEQLCVNEQDAVIPELFYIGLGGEMASELLNLKVSDVKASYIDENDNKVPAKIILPDREVIISERTYKIISDAIEQTIYIKGNGENSGLKAPTIEINPSEYVLRPASKTKFGQLKYSAFLMRVNRIRLYFGSPHISPTNLKISGQAYMAQQIKEQLGEVSKEDYIAIGKIFGSELPWNVIRNKVERYI